MKKVVIIAGMHRSGTSVAAQLCQHMGAYLGEKAELMGAARDNPGGFFENIEITKTNDEILRLCGREWYSLTLAEPDYHHPQIRKIKSDCPKITFEKRYGCHKRPTNIGIASVMGENFRWAGG